MSGRRARAACVALALVCGSCSRQFGIVPTGYATNIRLGFEEGGLIAPKPMTPCVSSLTVREEVWPTRAPGPVVWRIEAVADCTSIVGVDVGHVPDGFRETARRLPLAAGRMYGAEAEARPYDGGSVAWFVCRGAPVEAEWKDAYRLEARPAPCAG